MNSTSLSLRKGEIKTPDDSKCEDRVDWDSQTLAGGDIKWYSHAENSFIFSHKLNTPPSYKPDISLPDI